jgi:hypothetical protein
MSDINDAVERYIADLWRYKRREQHDSPRRPAILTPELCDAIERQVHIESEHQAMEKVRARHQQTTLKL